MNARIGILLLIAVAMLASCGPSIETTVRDKQYDRSGWVAYDTTAQIKGDGGMIDPGFGRLASGANDPGFGRIISGTIPAYPPYAWWSEDGKLVILRDSTRWHDSTLYV